MTWSHRHLLAVVLTCGIGVLLWHTLHFAALFHGNAIDDAYISFRYADHLAGGLGLAFNPGERIEGYSNFLWVLLLTPLVKLWDDPTRAAQVVCIVLAALAPLLGVFALRRVYRVTSPTAAGFVVLLLGASGYYASWSTSGLEGPLYSVLLLAAWLRYALEQETERGGFPASALLFGAIALARPEGVFLALAAVVLHLVFLRKSSSRSRQAWLFPCIVVGIVLAYELWRFFYYGPHLFPNSVRAKIGGGFPQFQHGTLYVVRNFLHPYLPLLLSLASFAGRRRSPGVWMGHLLLFGHLGFIAAAGGDWSRGRFFGPVLPLAAVLCAGALWTPSRLVSLFAARSRRLLGIATGCAYLLATFYVTSLQRELPRWRAWADKDVERIAIGKWLAETMPSDAKLAAFAVGQLAYYSGLYTHDMLGLTDPHIAGLDMPDMGRGVPGHEKYDASYTLETVRPDIIIGASLVPALQRHALYRNDYQRVSLFWKHHEVVLRRDFLRRVAESLSSTETGTHR